jgi:hypothetical protein
MTGHPGSTIIGHALPHRYGQSFHLPGEAVESGPGTVAVRFAQNIEAGFALNQRAHRRTVEGTLDQISLPVAQNDPRLNLFEAMNYPQRFRDHGASCEGCLSPSPRQIPVPHYLDHCRLQPTAPLRIDRLTADTLIGMHGPSLPAICSADQCKCTSLPWTQVWSAPPSTNLRRSPTSQPSRLMNPTSRLRAIVAVIPPAAEQFPPDRARTTTKKRSDDPQAGPPFDAPQGSGHLPRR